MLGNDNSGIGIEGFFFGNFSNLRQCGPREEREAFLSTSETHGTLNNDAELQSLTMLSEAVQPILGTR